MFIKKLDGDEHTARIILSTNLQKSYSILPDVKPHLFRKTGGLTHLEEADDHEDEAVGADAPGEDLVEVSLQEELLQHKD